MLQKKRQHFIDLLSVREAVVGYDSQYEYEGGCKYYILALVDFWVCQMMPVHSSIGVVCHHLMSQ